MDQAARGAPEPRSEVLVTQSELEKVTQDSTARKTAIEKLRAELAALDKNRRRSPPRLRSRAMTARGSARSKAKEIGSTSRVCGWRRAS